MQTGISCWNWKFFSQAEMTKQLFYSLWQWRFRFIIKQRHGGKKGFHHLFIMTSTNSLEYVEKRCKWKPENVLLSKQCTVFFLLIKILFLDFKSKLGGTDVLEQNYFTYSKLPWDVTYSPMYKDPQETTSQPKVIKVHDLPPAHQASAKTRHKILFVPNRLNIYLFLLMDNKNDFNAKGSRSL